MIKITRQQVLKRWDTLPQNLKDALFSEYNADILWRICQEQHLSEDKIYKIAALAGDAIMGFIHSQDLDDEIRKELGINAEIAASISRQIDRRIFLPIKADIDKVYSPAAGEAEPVKIAEENVVDLRKLESMSESAPDLKPEAAPIPPIPPVSPTSVSRPEKPKEAGQPEEEKPFIIHQEERMKPVFGQKRSLGGLFNVLKKEGTGESEAKPAPAKIQIGAAEKNAAVSAESLEPAEPSKPPKFSEPKTVHYSEFKTEISAPETAQRLAADNLQSQFKTSGADILKTPIPKPPVQNFEKKIIEASRGEKAKKGFFKTIIEFFKSLFIQKEVRYVEKIPQTQKSEERKDGGIKTPGVKPEIKIPEAKPEMPPKIIPDEIKMPPVKSREEIQKEIEQVFGVGSADNKEKETVDLRRAVEQSKSDAKVSPEIPPAAEQKPPFSRPAVKENEEMVDLRTMKKITDDRRPTTDDNG